MSATQLERLQQQRNRSRPIGSKSVLNGQAVIWPGEDYGWQSPGSYQQLEAYGSLRMGSSFVRRGTQSVVNALPQKVKQLCQWYAGKLEDQIKEIIQCSSYVSVKEYLSARITRDHQAVKLGKKLS